jgi:uncharacterized protein YndB with AHSA1/START domain
LTHIEHTVTIARPVEDVWAYVMDARNDPKWMTNVIEVGRGADQPVAVGLEIEETVQFYGVRIPTTLTITEHDPPRRSAIDARGPAGVGGSGSYYLEPVDGLTRFTMSTDTDAHGFFKLAEPLFARMARRDLASSAEHLKDLLEADGAS